MTVLWERDLPAWALYAYGCIYEYVPAWSERVLKMLNQFWGLWTSALFQPVYSPGNLGNSHTWVEHPLMVWKVVGSTLHRGLIELFPSSQSCSPTRGGSLPIGKNPVAHSPVFVSSLLDGEITFFYYPTTSQWCGRSRLPLVTTVIYQR